MDNFLGNDNVIRSLPAWEKAGLSRSYNFIQNRSNSVDNNFCNDFVIDITQSYRSELVYAFWVFNIRNQSYKALINVTRKITVRKTKLNKVKYRMSYFFPIKLIKFRLKPVWSWDLVRMHAKDSFLHFPPRDGHIQFDYIPIINIRRSGEIMILIIMI